MSEATNGFEGVWRGDYVSRLRTDLVAFDHASDGDGRCVGCWVMNSPREGAAADERWMSLRPAKSHLGSALSSSSQK